MNLLKSEGKKRTIASILAFIAAGFGAIPSLQPYQALLANLAGLFGLVGVTHAMVSKK